MTIYTLGIWRVKPGSEEDFVAAWQQLAENTKADYPNASAVLLQDSEDRSMFVSSGPWESQAQVEEWRASLAFTRGVAAILPSLEAFEPHSMDAVVVLPP